MVSQLTEVPKEEPSVPPAPSKPCKTASTKIAVFRDEPSASEMTPETQPPTSQGRVTRSASKRQGAQGQTPTLETRTRVTRSSTKQTATQEGKRTAGAPKKTKAAPLRDEEPVSDQDMPPDTGKGEEKIAVPTDHAAASPQARTEVLPSTAPEEKKVLLKSHSTDAAAGDPFSRTKIAVFRDEQPPDPTPLGVKGKGKARMANLTIYRDEAPDEENVYMPPPSLVPAKKGRTASSSKITVFRDEEPEPLLKGKTGPKFPIYRDEPDAGSSSTPKIPSTPKLFTPYRDEEVSSSCSQA